MQNAVPKRKNSTVVFNFYIKYIILLSFEVVPIVSPCSDNNSNNNNSSRSIACEQQTHFRSSLLSLGGRKATNGKRRSVHLQELHLIKLVLDHSKSLLTSCWVVVKHTNNNCAVIGTFKVAEQSFGSL